MNALQRLQGFKKPEKSLKALTEALSTIISTETALKALKVILWNDCLIGMALAINGDKAFNCWIEAAINLRLALGNFAEKTNDIEVLEKLRELDRKLGVFILAGETISSQRYMEIINKHEAMTCPSSIKTWWQRESVTWINPRWE
jgi:hypothetical protein